MANRNVPPQWPGDDGRFDSRPHPSTDRYRERPVAYHYPEQQSGPRWVGPDGGIDGSVAGLPEIYEDDEDDDGGAANKGRRRALIALGGAFAVAGGGAALSFTSQGRELLDKVLGGDGVDATADQLNNAISNAPAQQQPSTVRTYTEQNESYMGSRAGNELRRNAPATGRAYPTPSAAAANTKVTVKTVLAKDPVLHLARRATFGPTPQVIADIRRLGIDRWIQLQLDPQKIAPTPGELKLAELTTLTMSIPQLRANRDALNEKGTQADQEVVDAAVGRMIFSDRQLFEVMVDFWNDFLHVGPFFDGSDMVRSSFDRDVIRKHALGRYPDMLVAANRHPALLIYLNQNQSSKDNVNENLARENLELYSVGVDGGYTEKDVKQAALLQTGRSVRDDQYVYIPERHHVGPIKIMGFSHPNSTADGGEAASDAYFRFLALHPSTARYIALNLAVRFVSDTPPKSLIDRLAKTYLTSEGAIKPVLMTLFSSSEFWAAVGQKVRRPMEYLAATYRALSVAPTPSPGFQQGNRNRTPFAEGLRQIRNKMDELGQFPTGQATPNGYPDIFLAWTSAGTMINGWNEALDIVNGNRRMFSYLKPERFAGAKPPATAGAYVDALAKRLVHQTLTAKEKAAVLGIAGVAAGATVDASLGGALTSVVRALLASPQHHLR
ncbi:DUF1800 domain-containing protein [Asanoa siamensis]|uniref:DUF1800 domain-containing protein n=1 Tax=Asanoa siamensis TaxID=926357 RepID=A0ABQ4D091_9ACTN|nr:DUF1800 domain-containing protein [Asanoa siamensis]GIF76950.1 hypothetical protein Asi02nite_64680 [Asanoa siamensis]